ncbi:MAG: DUF378 domain-containing protein [Dehalococcoidia bacterium]|nr:MAG: DUF378 domain-containing protein [Dehalococcoidia bacterium]
MEVLAIICLILAVVGALNWGLVGLFKFDLVAAITGAGKFGEVNALSRIVYVLVAIAGIIAFIYYIF